MRKDGKISEQTEIPLIEHIKTIEYLVIKNKITEDDAWKKIESLMERISKFIKFYGIEFRLNIDKVREAITSEIISSFENLERKMPDAKVDKRIIGGICQK